MTLTGNRYRRRPSVIQRDVVGEKFLVPIHGHMADLQELFVLNEVGDWIWQHLDGLDLEGLAGGVCSEFEVELGQARADTEAFIDELLAAGLVDDDQGMTEGLEGRS